MPEYSNYLEGLDPVVGALSGDEIIGASKDGEAVSLTPTQIAALGGGGGSWGSITGTLSAQTDLQGALDAKAATSDVIGVQDLFFAASFFKPRNTAGCGVLTQVEFATSLLNVLVLPFDQTTQEYAQCIIVMPRKWNNGNITFVPHWTAQTGTGTVRWTLAGRVYRNDDALTAALGTAQTSDDTLIATNDLHIGPESSAITLAGTGQDGNLLALEISRDPANDTLNADALLIGISVRFTTDAAKDA